MSGGGYGGYNPYPNRFAAFGSQPNNLMAQGYPGSPGSPTYAQNPRNPNRMDMTGFSNGQAFPGVPPVANGRQNFNGAQWVAPQSPPSMSIQQPVNYMASPWAKGYGDGAPPVGGGATPPGVPGGTPPPASPPAGTLPPAGPSAPPSGPTNPGGFGNDPGNGRWWGSGPGPYPGGYPGAGNSPTNNAPMQPGQNSWGWQGPNNYTAMFNPSEKLYIQKMLYGNGNGNPVSWMSQVDPNNYLQSIGQLSGTQYNPNDPMWKV